MNKNGPYPFSEAIVGPRTTCVENRLEADVVKVAEATGRMFPACLVTIDETPLKSYFVADPSRDLKRLIYYMFNNTSFQLILLRTFA